MMKKFIYVAVTVMLLVGCTTKNEPSNSQKVPVSTTSLDVDYYEQMYQAYISSTLPEILHLDNIRQLWDVDANYDIDLIDTSYTNVSNIIQAYYDERVIHDVIVNTLYDNNIILDIDEYLNSETDVNLMDSLLRTAIETPYITLDYRTSIFENDNISDNDKVTLCFVFAIKNFIYKKIYGSTIVVIDEQGRYFSTQVPEDMFLPFGWSESWNLYEIYVDDLSNFNMENLGSYVIRSIEYESQDERDNYFYELETTYILYVTREECEEEFNNTIDELEMDAAISIMAMAVFSGFNPTSIMTITVLELAVFMMKYHDAEVERDRCIEEAEDSE